MKAKKTVSIICCLLVLIVVAISMTACLKISMNENSIKDRLTKAGAQIKVERTTPITKDGQSGYRIDDILLAKLAVTDRVDGEDVELDESLYVFFASDDSSADWIEKKCKEYVKQNDDLINWNVYRYDTIVMCGHYKILSIARSY